jgi:transposase InsO family protein
MEELCAGRHFDREVILLCVRWYLRYKLSLRDLVEMMAERGSSLAHTTILRWIQRYARQPAIPGAATKPAVGQRFHVCVDLARICVRRLRDRRLCPAHRRLAGEQFNADGLCAGRLGAGPVCPEREDGLIHHSDRGSQYVSIRYSERLTQAGIEPSVGSKGDSYDNALAETINGLYKAELIHRRAPWKTCEAVELATLEWVAWFNHHRLLEPIGYIPPAEAEANYYRQLTGQAELA